MQTMNKFSNHSILYRAPIGALFLQACIPKLLKTKSPYSSPHRLIINPPIICDLNQFFVELNATFHYHAIHCHKLSIPRLTI
ncbi:hypothetical protein DA89_2184 [Vibrio cholerae]|nr:hypothetical protein DA89_2184 [Vibrio cholerae]